MKLISSEFGGANERSFASLSPRTSAVRSAVARLARLEEANIRIRPRLSRDTTISFHAAFVRTPTEANSSPYVK